MPVIRTFSAELDMGLRPRSPVAKRCPEPQRNNSGGVKFELKPSRSFEAMENGGCSDMRVSILRRTHSIRTGRPITGEAWEDSSRCSTPTLGRTQGPPLISGTTRHTAAIVATTVLSISILALLALCAVAIAGNLQHEHTMALNGKPVRSRSAHLLAEGLASLASRLDNEAVEEYAPHRGYVRKALEATKKQIEAQRNDMASLQQYYDSQLRHMQEELRQQKALYEKQLEAQGLVLDDVFGNEDAESAVVSASAPETEKGPGDSLSQHDIL